MPREVRAWTTHLALGATKCAHLTLWRDGGPPQIPVRILPYDASDPPPDWPVGTKVRHKNNTTAVANVGSEPVRWRGVWWFVNNGGTLLECARWEPIPSVATVTLKVTGSPEKVALVRAGAVEEFWPAGLTVEVVEP